MELTFRAKRDRAPPSTAIERSKARPIFGLGVFTRHISSLLPTHLELPCHGHILLGKAEPAETG